MAINHVFHDLVGLVLALELLALVTVAEGDAAEAAVLQGAAEPMWGGVGLQLFGSGYFNAPRLTCREQAGELLGAERYAAYEAEGRELSREALVGRALSSPEERGGGAAWAPAADGPGRRRSARLPGLDPGGGGPALRARRKRKTRRPPEGTAG